MKKRCDLHLINWTMKQRNGGKRFKSIESGEVSIQSALYGFLITIMIY